MIGMLSRFMRDKFPAWDFWIRWNGEEEVEDAHKL